MPEDFVEHRPKSTDPNTVTAHCTVVVNGMDTYSFRTRRAAKDKACLDGDRPVHVARFRHLQDGDTPAQWRVDPC